MNLLAIAADFPMPDRSSGDLRFLEILKVLAKRHAVRFCAYRPADPGNAIDRSAYRAALEHCGVQVLGEDPIASIRSGPFDVVLFEFYFSAKSYLDEVRYWQPAARVVIDSVDVHFRRLFAKARITRAERDYLIAEEMRAVESEVYRRGDLVIAVSEEDRMTLRREIEDLPVELIPNIHAVLPLAARNGRLRNSLIFIGNFQHSPNVDAMLYFCKDVLPLVEVTVPDIHLTIVGSAPPEKLKKLADEHVKVVGFVPDILPILEASAISIAPLRYGAGLKGKIGEAMAYGLPVVTTSTGAEGFGLTPGENVLLGDTPEAFARAITALVRDADLYERVRRAAWQLVNERYSVNAVSIRIQEVVDRLNRYPIKRLGLARRLEMTVRYQLGRHVSWRLKQAG